MKIIIDEKPVCCKENEENLKYSMLAVKKTVDGYLPQRFYKGFFAVGFFEASFRGEGEKCSIVIFWFRLFLNRGPRNTFSFLGTQPHFENAHLFQSPCFTKRKLKTRYQGCSVRSKDAYLMK